ncbi:MAG: methionyl-tRNA formyltransferase [Bacilli bacterium]|nr:methionyl-tRNA formyltransferase [Bacilli bacterium]
MKNLKVIFMGTPFFSVPILEKLIEQTNVVLVVSMPDAVVGRKKILTASPVKKLAIENDIPVFSPKKIRDDYKIIEGLKPDIIITCAYGQILPKVLLDFPRLGCINIHASLLPKYRGGAPIHHAIMNGDAETGITIMDMDEKMDAGDIIKQKSLKINIGDNLETLSNKLSLLGRDIIIEVLPSIINGTNKRVKQKLAKVTYAPIIKRENELLDFHKSADEVYNLVRALSPSPYAYFNLFNSQYKIVSCEVTLGKGLPGVIISVAKDSFTIMCKDKGIKITKIKPTGKNEMTVKDFFNGFDKEKLLGKEVNNEE